MDQDGEDPPLTPIVGYDIHTDDEDVMSESSGEDSDNTVKELSQQNVELVRIFKRKREVTPEPNNSNSVLRRRLRRRRHKKMLKESKEEDPTPTPTPTPSITLPPPPSKEDQRPPYFPGFVTASGKEVKISEAAIKRALAFNGTVEKEDVENIPLKKTSVGTKLPGKFARPAAPKRKLFNPPPTSITPTSSKINAQTEPGMSQEMLEYVQALMEDEDAEGFS